MPHSAFYLIGGVLLLGYSYICFFKRSWAYQFSVAPVLEEHNRFAPFMLAAHGVISAVIGLALIIQFFRPT